MASDCLFCKIVAGEVPADVVADDELTVAFRDINPAAPTHVLVIPKRHVGHLGTLFQDDAGADAELFAAMIGMVQRVARTEGVADAGYRVVANVGRHGGMTIDHLHLHVLGGRPLRWPPE